MIKIEIEFYDEKEKKIMEARKTFVDGNLYCVEMPDRKIAKYPITRIREILEDGTAEFDW